MVDVRMIEGLMEAISPIIKTYVDERIAKDVTPLHAQIAAYKAMMPEKGDKGDPGEPGIAGKDVDPEVIKSAVFDVVADVLSGEVSAAISKIELPKGDKGDAGEPGVAGKDVDPEFIRTATVEVVSVVLPGLIAEWISKIELPKDGKDGEPGAPGKSIELEEVMPVLKSLVSEIELPQGQPGKDGEPGKDGQSVDIQDLIPVIAAEVENSVAQIELPKDGNSVTAEDVRPMLQEMVSALEPAKDGVDGKDADPVEVASLIVEDVAKLIPVPADGKSVTVEELAPLVDQIVSKKLPNLFVINEDGMLVTAYASGESKSIGKVRGEPGVRGASVMDGSVDEDGTLILRMSDGRLLQTGVVRGHDGQDGKDGTKGDPGRDAHEIQILPGIDESKTYIDGIVAYWRGGLIRSVRQTDPIVDGDILSAGWKVYLRGIAEEYEEQVDEGRFIEKTTVYTDGSEFKRRHKTATPLYQGVWREASYYKGDVVTWAGSSFIAQRDTQDKPETTDAWKLSTKRGRDGKDGKIDRPPPVVKLDPSKR